MCRLTLRISPNAPPCLHCKVNTVHGVGGPPSPLDYRLTCCRHESTPIQRLPLSNTSFKLTHVVYSILPTIIKGLPQQELTFTTSSGHFLLDRVKRHNQSVGNGGSSGSRLCAQSNRALILWSSNTDLNQTSIKSTVRPQLPRTACSLFCARLSFGCWINSSLVAFWSTVRVTKTYCT